MDKFLIRPSNGAASTSHSKRTAASTPPKTSATKKAKTNAAPTRPALKSNRAAAWSKVRSIPVTGAEYQDQTLLFTTLKDGRELLLGDQVWALPAGASAANPTGLKCLTQVGKMPGDRFTPLPGLDAAAVVIGGGFGSSAQRVSLCSLPLGTETINVPLPGIAADRNYGGSGFIRKVHSESVPNDTGAVCLLVCTDSRLFSFTVRETDGPHKFTCAPHSPHPPSLDMMRIMLSEAS